MADLESSAPLDIVSAAQNILSGDMVLPAAIISLSKLNSNIAWMQGFADNNGVMLSPHGKTTMCPAIFNKQTDAGAWAMTLATSAQVAAAAKHGATRVILANQLVGAGNMSLVSEHLDTIEFYCIVDSSDNVRELAEFFQKRKQHIRVLIEVGISQGRTGCRTASEVVALACTIAEYDSLLLAGIEVYEGILYGDSAELNVITLLGNVLDITQLLIDDGAFDLDEILLSGAGSAWYDLVTKHFKASALPDSLVPIIRPGAYVIHDTGMYNAFQDAVLKRSEAAGQMTGRLQNCLEVLAYIQSIPEEGLAIIAMGKRDIGFSDGLPSPEWHFRIGNEKPDIAPSHWEVFELMDQHTFMRINGADNIKVGDMIAFSASHPCLTCDKWREFVVVDDAFNVVDRWPTFF